MLRSLQKVITIVSFACWLACWSGAHSVAKSAEGARVVSFYGYDDCVELSNSHVKAVLCPAAGGRILSYSLGGENILYLPPGNEGWVWDGESKSAPMDAGRCDIGPEQIVPPRPLLWQGKWTAEIVGDRKAVLRSQDDQVTKVRLEREFELSADSSELQFTQRIINIGDEPVDYCHWSRTFVQGKGTCIVPVSRPNRFPQFYVRYDPPGKLINFAPSDPKIELVEDYLVINDHPAYPKLGFDSHRGWLAYLAKQDLLFVKKFPTYPDRAYNEVAGLTISVWYPAGNMVELEPIGPRENLQPGQASAFTETWYLVRYTYPGADQVEPKSIDSIVEKL